MAKLKPSSPAGDVLTAYLAAQVAALREHEPGVRTDAPDAIHQMRVATRRLRSALRTFRPVLDRARTEPLRAELRWLARALGDARDAEVLRDRLLRDLTDDGGASPSADAAADGDESLAATRQLVETTFEEEYQAARRSALEALDSDRYERLRTQLDALLTDPPLGPDARRKATKVLPKRARKAWRKVRTAHRAAVECPPEERDAALHELRKAAKQARYVGDALTPAFGKDAARFADAMEDIQDVLGEHQDSVVARHRMLTLMEQAWEADAPMFHLGRIVTAEVERRAAAQEQLERVWRRASKKKVHRWTS